MMQDDRLEQPLLANRDAGFSKLVYVLLALSLAGAAVCAAKAVRVGPNLVASDHRLAPSLSLIQGLPVYLPADSGPVVSSIYGPVVAVFYIPATLAGTPALAVQIGTLMSFLFMLVCGSIFLSRSLAGAGGSPIQARILTALPETSVMESVVAYSLLLRDFDDEFLNRVGKQIDSPWAEGLPGFTFYEIPPGLREGSLKNAP